MAEGIEASYASTARSEDEDSACQSRSVVVGRVEDSKWLIFADEQHGLGILGSARDTALERILKMRVGR